MALLDYMEHLRMACKQASVLLMIRVYLAPADRFYLALADYGYLD